MIQDSFHKDRSYTVVLKSGSTHNLVLNGLMEESFSNTDKFVLSGNIAIEKVIALIEQRVGSGKCDVEVGFWDEISKRKEANVIQVDRIFVRVPRAVMIPSDNIGLIEESAFRYFESADFIGQEVKLDNKDIMKKLPHWKNYYSLDLDGFFSTPPIIKGQMPNGEWANSMTKRLSIAEDSKQEEKGE